MYMLNLFFNGWEDEQWKQKHFLASLETHSDEKCVFGVSNMFL